MVKLVGKILQKQSKKGNIWGTCFAMQLVEVFNLLTQFAKLKVLLVIVSKVPLSLKQSPQL